MSERKAYLGLSIIWLIVVLAVWVLLAWWVALLLLLAALFLFDRSSRPYLPVLMYHSVSDHYNKFPKSELSVSRRNFSHAMRYLKLRGYRTLDFREAEAFTRGESFPSRSIHLTFDDGYLDNWVNVVPILEQHGFKGSVFVTDEFISRAGDTRPVRSPGREQDELEEWGFMNEAELVAVDRAGVLEVLPHGKTHTWYAKDDVLTGFHKPGDRQVWLDWNLRPEAKADWITEFPQGFAGEGWPILRFGKSLEVTRFVVDEDLLGEFQAEVSSSCQPLDTDSLLSHWKVFRERHPVIGRHESSEERLQRLREELGSTKSYLESLLGKPCDYFCWPGGGKQDESLKIAYDELGYHMTTTHQYETPNQSGQTSRWLYRVNGGYSVRFENPVWNLLLFASHVETYRRNYCWILPFAFCHAIEWLADKAGRKKRAMDRTLLHAGYPLK